MEIHLVILPKTEKKLNSNKIQFIKISIKKAINGKHKKLKKTLFNLFFKFSLNLLYPLNLFAQTKKKLYKFPFSKLKKTHKKNIT